MNSEPENFDLDIDIADPDDVDYLHPNGKQPGPRPNLPVTDYADGKSYRKALAEADGHSIFKYDPFIHDQNYLDLYATKPHRKWAPLFSGTVTRWVAEREL